MTPKPLVRLDDRVVLITGAAQGQGAAEAELFTELGATVVLTDIDADTVEQTAKQLDAAWHHHDTASLADWQRVVGAITDEHGRIDVLVNNAGIYRTGDLLTWPEADLERLLRINLMGPILGMQVVAPVMPEGSAIVNVASISGVRGHAGAAPYSASKWGLRGASRSAARELAPLGIRVNCVCPGSVDTPMIADSTADLSHLPIPRRGSSQEIAAMVAFLSCEASGYTTGADFVVDGGATA